MRIAERRSLTLGGGTGARGHMTSSVSLPDAEVDSETRALHGVNHCQQQWLWINDTAKHTARDGRRRLLKVVAVFSHSVVSNSLQLHGAQPARLLCPWDSPGNNAGVGCHALLQGIFPTQGSNWNLLHWQMDSLLTSRQGSPPKVLSF